MASSARSPDPLRIPPELLEDVRLGLPLWDPPTPEYATLITGERPDHYFRLDNFAPNNIFSDLGVQAVDQHWLGYGGTIPGPEAPAFAPPVLPGTGIFAAQTLTTTANPTSCSIEFWLLVTGDHNGLSGVLSSAVAGAGSIGLQDGMIVVYVAGGTSICATSRVKIDDGRWHHVVWTLNGSTFYQRIYVDGEDVTLVVKPTLAPTAYRSSGAYAISPGYLSFTASATDVFWKGGMAELALFPRVLQGWEVRRHYRAMMGSPGRLIAADGTCFFSGSGDFLALAAEGNVPRYPEPFTLMFTVAQVASLANAATPMLLTWRDTTPKNGVRIRISGSVGVDIAEYDPSGANISYQASAALTPGTYNRWAMLHGGGPPNAPVGANSLFNVYLNGTLVKSGNAATSWAAVNTLHFNADAGFTTATPYGSMYLVRDVFLFDRVLNAGEIKRVHELHAGWYPAAVLQDSPVAYWRLSDPAGELAADWSGAGVGIQTSNGTYASLRGIGRGQRDRLNDASLSGYGVSSSALCTVARSIGGLFSISLDCWARMPNIPDSGGLPGGKIAAGCCSGSTEGAWAVQINSGTMVFQVQAAAFQTSVGNADDDWHHYGWSFTGSASTFYFDGQQVFSTNPSRSLTATESIGIFQGPGSAPQPFLGWCQDLAIYSGQLAAARFSAHFTVG